MLIFLLMNALKSVIVMINEHRFYIDKPNNLIIIDTFHSTVYDSSIIVLNDAITRFDNNFLDF